MEVHVLELRIYGAVFYNSMFAVVQLRELLRLESVIIEGKILVNRDTDRKDCG